MLGRIASTEERKSPTVVLKDIDLMISHKKFVLGKERKQELVKQARRFASNTIHAMHCVC